MGAIILPNQLLADNPLLSMAIPGQSTCCGDGGHVGRANGRTLGAVPDHAPAQNHPHILPGLIEDSPMYRVVVDSAAPIKRAMAFNKSTDLTRRGRRLEATVYDTHDVLIAGY